MKTIIFMILFTLISSVVFARPISSVVPEHPNFGLIHNVCPQCKPLPPEQRVIREFCYDGVTYIVFALLRGEELVAMAHTVMILPGGKIMPCEEGEDE